MLLCRLTLETEWGTFWHMDMEKSRPLKRNKHTAVTELRPPWVLDLKYSDLLTWKQNSHGCLFWLLLRWAHPDVCFTGYWRTEPQQSKTEWLWVRLDSSKTLVCRWCELCWHCIDFSTLLLWSSKRNLLKIIFFIYDIWQLTRYLFCDLKLYTSLLTFEAYGINRWD